jgi:hypothetical protein
LSNRAHQWEQALGRSKLAAIARERGADIQSDAIREVGRQEASANRFAGIVGGISSLAGGAIAGNLQKNLIKQGYGGSSGGFSTYSPSAFGNTYGQGSIGADLYRRFGAGSPGQNPIQLQFGSSGW